MTFLLELGRAEQVEDYRLDDRLGHQIQAGRGAGDIDHDAERNVLGLVMLDVVRQADEEDLLVNGALQDGLARDDMAAQVGQGCRDLPDLERGDTQGYHVAP